MGNKKKIGDLADKLFTDRQKKVMKQLGRKDTYKVAKLVNEMKNNCCDDCKLKMEIGELICNDCLEKNKEVMQELKALKNKMRGY